MDSGHPQHHPRAGLTPWDIVVEARRWLGVPWRHQGRTRQGLDCVGFVWFVLTQKGLTPPDFRKNYGRLPREEMILQCSEHCIRTNAAELGGLVLIRWPGERAPAHAALCTGVNLIHSYARVGQVVEHGYRKHWLAWTHSTWRLPSVRYE